MVSSDFPVVFDGFWLFYWEVTWVWCFFFPVVSGDFLNWFLLMVFTWFSEFSGCFFSSDLKICKYHSKSLSNSLKPPKNAIQLTQNQSKPLKISIQIT